MICVMFKLIDFRIPILKANVGVIHMVCGGFLLDISVHRAAYEQ